MEPLGNRNKIYKQIKIPPITQRHTTLSNYQNNTINHNKFQEKLNTSSSSQKKESEKKTSLINKSYIQTLLKSSSTSNMRESIKFSPNKINVKENTNLTNKKIAINYLKNIKNEKINDEKANCLDKKKKINNINSEDEKINQLNLNLLTENNEKLKKSRNFTLKNNVLLTKQIFNFLEPVKEKEENEENEEIISTTSSTTTNSIFEGKKISMLQQYFNLSKTKQDILLNSAKNLAKKKFSQFPNKLPLKSINNENQNNNNNKVLYRHKSNKSFDNNSFNRVNEEKDINLNNNADFSNSSFEESVNIEDLIIVEERYETIEKFINNGNYYLLNKTCYEWWNFYYNCTIKGNLTQFFIDIKIKKIIEDTNILTLISMLIIYELSYKPEFFESNKKLLKKILSLCNKNYLLICNNFLSKIKEEFLNSIWVERLRNIITLNKVNTKEYYINQIDKNTDETYETITLILSLIKNNYHLLNTKIIEIFNNYSKYTHEKIYRIFLTNICKLNNEGGSILYSTLKSNTPLINFNLKISPMKPLTLFLDLDETLISFVFSKENEGISRIRPYLFQFLNLVKHYFELIIFTAATRDYADPILNVIEGKKGTYFTYRLYRESCSIINNYYVKDIGRFGIDLSKCVIVDNMAQNFKLQKENGILISSFWGEDTNDKALLFLGRILASIGMEMMERNYLIDIRDELLKYRNELLKKVSMK